MRGVLIPVSLADEGDEIRIDGDWHTITSARFQAANDRMILRTWDPVSRTPREFLAKSPQSTWRLIAKT